MSDTPLENPDAGTAVPDSDPPESDAAPRSNTAEIIEQGRENRPASAAEEWDARGEAGLTEAWDAQEATLRAEHEEATEPNPEDTTQPNPEDTTQPNPEDTAQPPLNDDPNSEEPLLQNAPDTPSPDDLTPEPEQPQPQNTPDELAAEPEEQIELQRTMHPKVAALVVAATEAFDAIIEHRIGVPGVIRALNKAIGNVAGTASIEDPRARGAAAVVLSVMDFLFGLANVATDRDPNAREVLNELKDWAQGGIETYLTRPPAK